MAWSRVQSNAAFKDGTSVTSVAVTLAATVGANSIVYGFAWTGFNRTITSVTDDKGNTYTVLDVLNLNGRFYSFYCLNVTNAPQTITIHFSGSTSFCGAIVGEISGGGASAALSGHAINSQSGVSTATDAITIGTTIGANGDFMIACTAQIEGNGDSFVHGTNFTDDFNNLTATDFVLLSEYKALTGATAATFTTGTSDDFITAAMTFSGGGGGGGANTKRSFAVIIG